MDENELGLSVGYEADCLKQKFFSITAEESRQVKKEYEINDMEKFANVRKAYRDWCISQR